MDTWMIIAKQDCWRHDRMSSRPITEDQVASQICSLMQILPIACNLNHGHLDAY